MSDLFDQRLFVYKDHIESCQASGLSLSKARNRLYIVALGTLAVYLTNAIPTEITGLGIDFSNLQAGRILPFLSLACAYFLVLFFLRAVNNVQRRRALYEATSLLNAQLAKATGDEKLAADSAAGKATIDTAADKVTDSILLIVPVVVGVAGSLVGFSPQGFDWLKDLLNPGFGFGGGR